MEGEKDPVTSSVVKSLRFARERIGTASDAGLEALAQ